MFWLLIRHLTIQHSFAEGELIADSANRTTDGGDDADFMHYRKLHHFYGFAIQRGKVAGEPLMMFEGRPSRFGIVPGGAVIAASLV